MTANDHTIDLAQVMSEHLERAEPDLLRSLLKKFVQALLSADADAVCGAPYGTRSPERWVAGMAQLVAEDDVQTRLDSFGMPMHARNVRRFGTELRANRVDLDQPTAPTPQRHGPSSG